jgi:MoxR-like ATPase
MAEPATGLAELDLRRLERLAEEVGRAFRGNTEVVRLATVALLARGHVLFEDVPGVGKTTLARAFAAALGLDFRRVQFTSDLLPADVLGVSIYNPATQLFQTHPGPIFANVVLADEINRAPPRTQSGLLEAMQEGTVSLDDRTYALPRPFMVIATQNPLEQHGTYPLPESQLDRFLMRLTLGFPAEADERQVLLEHGGVADPLSAVRVMLDAERVLALQEAAAGVHADPSVVDYLLAIVRATREDPRLRAGASTRGGLSLFQAAKAHALVGGRGYLVPDDVRRLVVPCLAHRVLPADGDDPGAAAAALEEIADAVPVPV